MSGVDSAASLDRRNQFISPRGGRKHSSRGIALPEYDFLLCLCDAIVHNATSYLISSSSSSSPSSASIVAEIATRCLPWAQRRQLLIYRDRTTEPLTPASTRSIPIAPLVALSLSLSSLPLSFFHLSSHRFPWSSRHRHRIRCEVDLSLLPRHRTLFARRGIEGGSWTTLRLPATMPGIGTGLARMLPPVREREREREKKRWFCLRDKVTSKTMRDLPRIDLQWNDEERAPSGCQILMF